MSTLMTGMNKVLVDTSAWVDFFRRDSGSLGDLVAELIRADRACLTGPIVAELLHGVRGKEEAGQLELVFATVNYLEIHRRDWESAGNILRDLRKNGITIPLTDVLIANVAIRNKIPVLTLDRHFHHLEVEFLAPENSIAGHPKSV